MAAEIQRLAAKSVFDPPAYTQTIKVTGAQTTLFISGQIDYDDKGQPGHPETLPLRLARPMTL
jgi:enamine deaminase RidA (YjgF/YER057c/UK114 family)